MVPNGDSTLTRFDLFMQPVNQGHESESNGVLETLNNMAPWRHAAARLSNKAARPSLEGLKNAKTYFKEMNKY